MPVIGYFLGISFDSVITEIDHWVAFILLSLIGSNMLKESLFEDREKINDKVDFKSMIPLAIATSIDALAVGITLSFLKVNIILSALVIGIITFILSVIGVKFGNKFSNKYYKKAQFFGGIILILMGMKILSEHLGIF